MKRVLSYACGGKFEGKPNPTPDHKKCLAFSEGSDGDVNWECPCACHKLRKE